MKKKALFAVLAAAVMLPACSGKPGSEMDSGNPSGAQESPAAEGAGTDALPETETEADNEEGEEEPEAGIGDGYVKGTVTDTGWESEYLGMRYIMPEGMLMATEEELNQVMGLGAEILSGDINELQMEYARMRTVYEMMSTDATGATNVVLTVEKLLFSNMDAEQYVQSLEQGLKKMSAISYTVLSDDETVEIAGMDYIKVSVQAQSGDVAVNQDYYVRVADGRAVSFVITSQEETAQQAEAVLNAFTAY